MPNEKEVSLNLASLFCAQLAQLRDYQQMRYPRESQVLVTRSYQTPNYEPLRCTLPSLPWPAKNVLQLTH